MPGNEAEDRVHNFFPQEGLSSGHHHSQAADGSWQELGNNLWPGSQRRLGLPASNSKGYNLQQSDIERGQNSAPFQVADSLNYGQPTRGPVLAASHSQSQLPNSNGYMHGRQILQTRQNEANFLGVDAEYDRYAMTSRGLSVYESQGRNGLENNVGSVRSESSESRVSFLGGHQQMSGQQIGMLQSLPQQLSGFNDMQLLQQQVMLRKMQELQKQHLEARQNNSLSPNPSLINGTPISPITAASNYACPAEPSAGNKIWLPHATQAAQRSPNELRFPTEQGQSLSLMGLIPQQVDQSIYGVPVSNTRGTPSRYSHVSVENHPTQQMAMNSNTSPGDQYRGPTNQVYVQEGSLSSRQGFQEENFFGQPSGQGLARGRMYSGNSELVNSLQRDSPVQEFTGPSETMEGKTVLPVSSLQNTVALDPTEEKILFGDGNIWDTFGNSANIGEVGGSWSALMQSAVAETSSNDIGLKEKCSGPSIHNTEIAVGALPDDVNNNRSFLGVPEFQQSVPNYPYEHGDRLQMDSAHRSFQQSSEEGSKWLSRGPLQKPQDEGTQIYQNTTCSSGAMVNAKSMPGSWAAQQNIPAHISDQLYGKPNGHDDVETPLSGGNEVSTFHGNESRFQRSGSNDQKRMLRGEMSQGVRMWKMVPGQQSTGGVEQVSGMGSTQVNREEAGMNTRSRRPNSSTAQASEGISSNSNNLNFWKHAENPNMSKGNEHYLNKGSLVLESSMNSSGNDVVNMRETENSERKENSSDSHHSNISQRTIAVGSNYKVWLDGSDNQNLLGKMQKVRGQGGQNVSGPRKFQYHPMGNLNEDVESSFERKCVFNNQSQRYLGQSKVFGQFPKTSREIEKGHMFSVQQNKKGTDDLPSRGTLAGFARNTSQLSQNVPELLHNMDQSKENSNSDGSIGPLQQSRSPSSHDFGLQLGFPSQLLPARNHALSSHGSAQLAGSLSSAHATYEKREKDNTSQAEPFSYFHETSGEFNRNETTGTGPNSNDAQQYSMLGNLNSASTSGFPFLRGQIQGQQVIGAVDGHNPHSSQNRINQKDGILSSGDTSQLTEGIATREKVATQEISMGRIPNAWNKPPSQQNILGGQLHNKFPPSIFRPSQSNNNAVSTLGEGQPAQGSHHQLGSSADLVPTPSVSQGRESVHKNQYDASPSNSASTERDYEAFGDSLKPSNLPHHNYSLLNQMQAMKSTEIDPSNRGLKRFKGAESSVGSEMRQSSEQRVMVGEPRILSFSGSSGSIDNNSSPLLANVLPQDVHAPSRMDSANYPCSSTTSSLRVEHSQISPQMAPSWFEHYGTFKNGQMLSMYNAHQHSTFKTIEQRLPLGKSSDTLCASNTVEQANPATDYIQSGNMRQRSIPTTVTVENLPSTQLMIPDVIDKGLVAARPTKRKSATPLTSWHKEVTQGSESLLTTSKAEVEWAKATNRLIDELEDEAETFEDRPPGFRSRRRLILTTQLMQQLFRPPAASTLSADAYSNYEAVACMGARLTLGDAYNLMHCSKSDSYVPLDSLNSLIDKHKTTESERNSDQRLSEVTEHFIGRAKKLESDFMRLDKRASVVDLRVESQDLEKVSVINRFARFHGRGQADLTPPGPQRYVNALPIPRVLPERVQCLSL